MAAQLSSVPTSRTRNLCIVAHVDHGKSSFADSLLASNGIISTRLAGTIRYLDSREDEQERGITMESSAVSLKWRVPTQTSPDAEPVLQEYRINLIDTPGHVDFSSEVSTASRLCDGALVLVDAVEGVCTQTITVLRTTYLSHLRPILVINKIDRLITELKLSPSEAYHHMSRIIEDVNAIVGSFFASDRMEDDWRWRERKEAAGEGVDEEYQERDDSNLYFDPSNGTVIFASAIDGWAFRISRFAQLYATKLGMSEPNLNRCLWGDWYLDPKSRRVINRKKMDATGKKLKPLFVQFVLENIWAVYDAVTLNNNPTKIDKIITSLSVKVRPQDLRSKDTRNLLLAIFAQWLPLAPSTFRAVIDKIPPPPAAQAERVPHMLHPDLSHGTVQVEPQNKLERDLYEGDDGADRFCVAYVSKMFSVKTSDLPENQRKQLTADDMRARARAIKEARERRTKIIEEGGDPDAVENGVDEDKGESLQEDQVKEVDPNAETLLGFVRLYSGTVAVGQSLYAVLPKYNAGQGPSHPSNAKHLQAVEVEQLYMMMGRELVAVPEVHAGNLFAVKGLEGKVMRNATLCSSGKGRPILGASEVERDRECLVNLAGVSTNAAPIVRVALEPEEPSEMPKLVEGLRMLNQADPCVETLVQETGEHVILTAGELHLERCLKDLRDRFARIEITVSPPIVPFRETSVVAPEMVPSKHPEHPRGTFLGTVGSGLVKYSIRAVPMPPSITSFLTANMSTLKRLQQDRRGLVGQSRADDESDEARGDVTTDEMKPVKPEEFWTELDRVLKDSGKEWAGLADCVWAFGPRRVGPNMLIDKSGARSLKKRLERQAAHPSSTATPVPLRTPAPGSPKLEAEMQGLSIDAKELESQLDNATDESAATVQFTLPSVRELDENIDTGFQLAMNRGPLCGEPIVGMSYFLEQIDLDAGELEPAQVRQRWTSARGQIISATQDSFKSGLLDWSPRLLLAMYSCDIQASGEVLGKVYGVVAKRKGRIVSEEMKEGTAFFTIRALLPVVESFGFADDIRTRTSGAASPQLVFHGYEILDQDPFWVPTTEEELEDLGEKADRENVAKRYMETVRKRKGMAVERKVVEFAEKQKTLKRG
ncbi:Cytoplasmic GTPase/eEF2-like protein (ribosomal biogenesis) [Microbotryomycetes sp. JL201]|nr:Cytoplasmic GTPase/eEF2-like protein (ribosomal biogenesis) [Microbotryomycetes sp. JL201]